MFHQGGFGVIFLTSHPKTQPMQWGTLGNFLPRLMAWKNPGDDHLFSYIKNGHVLFQALKAAEMCTH